MSGLDHPITFPTRHDSNQGNTGRSVYRVCLGHQPLASKLRRDTAAAWPSHPCAIHNCFQDSCLRRSILLAKRGHLARQWQPKQCPRRPDCHQMPVFEPCRRPKPITNCEHTNAHIWVPATRTRKDLATIGRSAFNSASPSMALCTTHGNLHSRPARRIGAGQGNLLRRQSSFARYNPCGTGVATVCWVAVGGEEMMRMCAWCGNRLGQAAPLEDVTVTHGICLTCSLKLLLRAGVKKVPPALHPVREMECALAGSEERSA
jgi:hypothetical protein